MRCFFHAARVSRFRPRHPFGYTVQTVTPPRLRRSSSDSDTTSASPSSPPQPGHIGGNRGCTPPVCPTYPTFPARCPGTRTTHALLGRENTPATPGDSMRFVRDNQGRHSQGTPPSNTPSRHLHPLPHPKPNNLRHKACEGSQVRAQQLSIQFHVLTTPSSPLQTQTVVTPVSVPSQFPPESHHRDHAS